MKEDRHLTRPDQYDHVYKQGNSFVDRFIVVRAVHNDLECSRFGISVSKRIGNAVKRNRVKRILREILGAAKLKPGWDIIVIARLPSAGGDYHRIQQSVSGLLFRAQIIVDQ